MSDKYESFDETFNTEPVEVEVQKRTQTLRLRRLSQVKRTSGETTNIQEVISILLLRRDRKQLMVS